LVSAKSLFGDSRALNLAVMDVSATYLDGSRFEIQARGHRVICDQPTDNGGSDAGMTPPEFLLASLASCAAYYAAQYLKTRGLPTEHLKVRAGAEKTQSPAKLSSFRVDVTAPGLDQRHQTGILRAAKACLIHNTLLGQPSIDIVVNSPAAQPDMTVAR
jgi:putative redox protein